jgi:Domain of unknown function DUF11
MGGKRLIAGLVVVLAALLALPAAAQAANDLSISQTASANQVKPGGTVTLSVTVTNLGTEAANPGGDGSANLNLYSWGEHAAPTKNTYQSVTPSQGSCNVTPVGQYQNAYCTLGALAPGASAQVTAVVQANESADHFAQLLGQANSISDYSDDNSANNVSRTRIFAAALVVTGSKQLKFKGLPDGCVTGDFTLDVTAKAPHVKKVKASASLGVDEEGFGQFFNKTAKGNHLKTTFPASKAAVVLNRTYELRVKARLKGGKRLKATITYTRC